MANGFLIFNRAGYNLDGFLALLHYNSGLLTLGGLPGPSFSGGSLLSI